MAREQPLIVRQKEDFLMALTMAGDKTELESDLPALNSTRGKPVSMIDDPELA